LSGNSDDQQDDEEGRAVIHFHQINEEEEEEDDDDDDDDDGDENGTEAVTIIKQWGKSLDDESSSRSESLSTGSNNGPKDALRQNCISALRKLANQVRHLAIDDI
jgi:hypothetical protein